MGRKRIDVNLKKIKVGLGIQKYILDILKEEKVNISDLVNEYLKEYVEKLR